MPDSYSWSMRVLLIEDNPADARLVQLALERCRGTYELWVASDGPAALDYLKRIVQEGGPPRPDLVLLDLNLPGMTGHDVLARLKADPESRALPVIVLSTSDREEDVRFCYEHHAQSYVRKPASLEAFERVFQEIEAYWRGIATLTPRPG